MTGDFKPVSSSKISISELMLPSHTNFSGKIHGGYILQLLDQIAFASASKFCGNYCVTASVDTVNFLKPIEVGELVTITDGPFKDMEGKVNDVDKAKGKLKVLVNMFGRETPVELDFLQVKKV